MDCSFQVAMMPRPPTLLIRRLPSLGWKAIDRLDRLAEALGAGVLSRVGRVATILAVLWATARLSIRSNSWTPPVRAMFARQVLFTSVDSIPASLRFAATFGVLMIVQTAIWIDMVGATTDVIAPMLWRFIVRELAPLLACLVVIGRSGIAIGTDLATMRASGEIEILDSQGIDPMTYLVMPRILSVILSVACLAAIIAVTMVFTGYAVGWMMDVIRMSWSDFFSTISRNINVGDLIFFASKTLIAGAFAGAICCLNGMSVRGAITDVPLVSSRVGIQALTAVFLVSAILSILFYGKLLIFKIG